MNAYRGFRRVITWSRHWPAAGDRQIGSDAPAVLSGQVAVGSTAERRRRTVYFGPLPSEEVVVEVCTPFTLAVPDETLVDLRERLDGTRYIDDFDEDSDWTYGVSRSYLRELCEYWRTTFDWRAQEAILNSLRSVPDAKSTVSRSTSSMPVRPTPSPFRCCSSTVGLARSSSS